MASHDDLRAARESKPRLVAPALTMTRDALTWDITVADDGELFEGGVMPTLIAWPGGVSPAANMPDAGLRLRALELIHPEPLALAQALRGLGWSQLTQPNARLRFAQGRSPGLALHLDTPRGQLVYRGGNL